MQLQKQKQTVDRERFESTFDSTGHFLDDSESRSIQLEGYPQNERDEPNGHREPHPHHSFRTS